MGSDMKPVTFIFVNWHSYFKKILDSFNKETRKEPARNLSFKKG
jgi:hypothetical protein